MPKAPACCREIDEGDSETEAAELAMVGSSAPSLEDEEVVAVPVFEDKNQAETTLQDNKPADTLDRAAAADASDQPMTSDKEPDPMTDKQEHPKTIDKEKNLKKEEPNWHKKKKKNLKRPRSDTSDECERGCISRLYQRD